ncbi:hypothetical protein Tco_0370558 [Tanacetum coccineum]
MPGSDEGSLELNELMDLVTKLSDRVFDLEKVKMSATEFIKEKSLVDKGMAFVQEKDAENQGKISADDTEVVKGSGDTEVLDTEKAVNTRIFDDEDVTMAMAQTLIKMKEEKAKEKGVVIKDVKLFNKDASVEKQQKKVQGDAQIERDAKVALRLQAELDEELRLKEERQEEEAF